MADLPTDSDIKRRVHETIAGFARVNTNRVSDADELISTLGLTDEDLPFLAMSLRGYVKKFKPKRTITTLDLRKAKTVSGTVKIVQERITK